MLHLLITLELGAAIQMAAAVPGDIVRRGAGLLFHLSGLELLHCGKTSKKEVLFCACLSIVWTGLYKLEFSMAFCLSPLYLLSRFDDY